MIKKILALMMCVMIFACYCKAEPAWTYPIYIRALISDINTLVNKDNPLDEKYEPHDLVPVKVRKSSSVEMLGRSVAVKALQDMFAAAEKEGITLYLKSAYRSYSTQNTMYSNRLEKNKGVDDELVQYPGSSEHQSGLSFDVVNQHYAKAKGMNAGFFNTNEGKWLDENCAKFGFVIRYPNDKEDITKIKYEPWHIRYLGLDIANYMLEHDLCHEEFTEEWKAALEAYESEGGTISTAIEYETRATAPSVTEQNLDNGDTEISLEFND